MEDTKIQWHPGFVAAMNLEFLQNKDDLVFVKEHNLNTKPLEIDLLVIKKGGVLQRFPMKLAGFSVCTIFLNIRHQVTIWMRMYFLRFWDRLAFISPMGNV